MKRSPKILLLLLLTLLSLYGFYRVSLRLAINRHLAAIRSQGLPATSADLARLHPSLPEADLRSGVATLHDLLLGASDRVREGDTAGAIQGLQDWLAKRKTLDERPTFLLISLVWQQSADFAETLQELLTRTATSDEQLIQLSNAIQDQHGPDLWLRTLAIERVLTHEEFENPQTPISTRDWLVSPALKFLAVAEYDQLVALNAWEKIQQASAKPFPHAWPLVIAAQQHYQDRSSRTPDSRLSYASPCIHWHLQHPTYMNLALTGIAAERYRLAHGRWPTQLGDLVPAYLPAAPLDPFGEGPIKIKVTQDGFIAYSVALNCRDDHAAYDDFTFTITRPRK